MFVTAACMTVAEQARHREGFHSLLGMTNMNLPAAVVETRSWAGKRAAREHMMSVVVVECRMTEPLVVDMD